MSLLDLDHCCGHMVMVVSLPSGVHHCCSLFVVFVYCSLLSIAMCHLSLLVVCHPSFCVLVVWLCFVSHSDMVAGLPIGEG